jgi:hypothetical protein
MTRGWDTYSGRQIAARPPCCLETGGLDTRRCPDANAALV